MAKVKGGPQRAAKPSTSHGAPATARRESGGFFQQLGLAETGGTSPGLVGIGLAMMLALATYPIAWLIRRMRRRR